MKYNIIFNQNGRDFGYIFLRFDFESIELFRDNVTSLKIKNKLKTLGTFLMNLNL